MTKEHLYGYLLVNDAELAELIAGRVPARVIERAIVLAETVIDRLKRNAARPVAVKS